MSRESSHSSHHFFTFLHNRSLFRRFVSPPFSNPLFTPSEFLQPQPPPLCFSDPLFSFPSFFSAHSEIWRFTVVAASKIRNLMADWGPVVIAVVLFVLLSPGLLFQIPGRGRVIEFGNMHTSGASILVHAIIYFGLITIFLVAIGVHIYTG